MRTKFYTEEPHNVKFDLQDVTLSEILTIIVGLHQALNVQPNVSLNEISLKLEKIALSAIEIHGDDLVTYFKKADEQLRMLSIIACYKAMFRSRLENSGETQ